MQVKRLKRDDGAMVVVLAVGPPWWIDVQQLHSVASYPTSRSVVIRRRVHVDDVQLPRTLHSLVCAGITANTVHIGGSTGFVWFRRTPRSSRVTVYKNSSGDEIANVRFYAVDPEATRIR